MTIILSTNRRYLGTWRELAAWYHVHWLRVIGGLDFGMLEKNEVLKLAKRYRGRLREDLAGFLSKNGEPEDGKYRAVLEAVFRHLDGCIRNWDKMSFPEVRNMSYGISNAFTDVADMP